MELTQAFNGFIQQIVSNLGTSPFRSGIPARLMQELKLSESDVETKGIVKDRGN